MFEYVVASRFSMLILEGLLSSYRLPLDASRFTSCPLAWCRLCRFRKDECAHARFALPVLQGSL